MRRAGFAACAGVSLGLAGVIALELSGGDTAAEPAVSARTTAAPTAARNPLEPSHIDQWIATSLERPLFAPDRRPPAQGAVLSGGSGPHLPRLAGVLVSAEGRRAIFAAEPSNAKPTVIPEGARIGAWTVRAIAAGEVTVAGPDGVHTVHPAFDPSPPPPAPPPLVQQPPEPVIPQPQFPQPPRGRATVRPDR